MCLPCILVLIGAKDIENYIEEIKELLEPEAIRQIVNKCVRFEEDIDNICQLSTTVQSVESLLHYVCHGSLSTVHSFLDALFTGYKHLFDKILSKAGR